MKTLIICLLAFFTGGIGYRLRGSSNEGGWASVLFGAEPGLTIGRMLFWAYPVTCFVTALTGNLLIAPLIFLSAWLGVVPGYFGGEFNIEDPKNRNWKNYLRLTLRGMWIAAPLCDTLVALNYLGYYHGDFGWGGMIAGALFVFNYWIWIRIGRTPHFQFIHGYVECGEFLTGGLVMVGIALTIA